MGNCTELANEFCSCPVPSNVSTHLRNPYLEFMLNLYIKLPTPIYDDLVSLFFQMYFHLKLMLLWKSNFMNENFISIFLKLKTMHLFHFYLLKLIFKAFFAF